MGNNILDFLSFKRKKEEQSEVTGIPGIVSKSTSPITQYGNYSSKDIEHCKQIYHYFRNELLAVLKSHAKNYVSDAFLKQQEFMFNIIRKYDLHLISDSKNQEKYNMLVAELNGTLNSRLWNNGKLSQISSESNDSEHVIAVKIEMSDEFLEIFKFLKQAYNNTTGFSGLTQKIQYKDSIAIKNNFILALSRFEANYVELAGLLKEHSYTKKILADAIQQVKIIDSKKRGLEIEHNVYYLVHNYELILRKLLQEDVQIQKLEITDDSKNNEGTVFEIHSLVNFIIALMREIYGVDSVEKEYKRAAGERHEKSYDNRPRITGNMRERRPVNDPFIRRL